MKRRNKIAALLLGAVLLWIALDARLAQPEPGPETRDRFVGFHAVFQPQAVPVEAEDPAGSGEMVLYQPYRPDDSQWTVYGEDSLRVQGLGRVRMEKKILIGREDGEGHFVFPGLEGKNCFLAELPREDGGVRYGGYADTAETEVSLAEGARSLRGTVYFGPPLLDGDGKLAWEDCGVWTLYPVYQMEDGTVYLTDSTEGSYGGAGGVTITRSEKETLNGADRYSQEISVSITSIPRLERLTLRQFDGDDALLDTAVLTQEEAWALEKGRLELALAEGTAYVIAAREDTGGGTEWKVFQPDGDGEVSLTDWFLGRNGMGIPVRIRMSEEGRA